MSSETAIRHNFQKGTASKHPVGKQADIAALRQLIATTERRDGRGHGSDDGAPVQGLRPWRSGVPNIDLVLPESGLSRRGVHEVSGASYADTIAASAYLLALLKRLADVSDTLSRAPVLWCQPAWAQREFGSIYGTGLRAFGFDPKRFLFVHATRNSDLLWALEEGARAGCLLAAIGEVDTVSFTQTRRLSLAAAVAGTPVLLLRSEHDRTASAAETRWRVRAEPRGSDPLVPDAPGNAHWQVELSRCRGGRPANWTVEWEHEAYRLRLVEDLCSRSPEMADAPLETPRLRLASG